MATDNFMKLTVKNQSQIDALKKIGKHDFGVNGGRIVMNGTDLSIFQGDVENFKNSELGNYNAEQLETIFGALDADGNGKLDMKELKSFAALGEDSDNIIDDDKNIIDETDFEALYTMAQDYVEEALVEEPETDSKVDIPTVDDKTKEDEKVSQDENPTDIQDNVITEETEKTVIDDNEAAAAAEELRSAMAGLGTDEKTVTRVLMESGYSSADIVKIMDSFESTYGESLMSDIQGDYSGNAETQLRNLLYNSAAAEAQTTLNWQSTNDIPQEIANQANELYSRLESGGEKSYMKEFSKLSNEEQAKIMLACDLLHPNESVMDRLTQGKVWFGKEDGYVDNIIKGMKKVANTKVS